MDTEAEEFTPEELHMFGKWISEFEDELDQEYADAIDKLIPFFEAKPPEDGAELEEPDSDDQPE